MKKIMIVLSCIAVVLTLCACNSNKKEETKYTLNVVYEGGVERHYDTYPEMTPTIHEGLELYYDRDYKGCIEKLMYGLTKGEFDPVAYFQLGYMYYFGMGVEKDIEIAKTYFKKGAEYNEPECVYYLGASNLLDDGNIEDAKKFFDKALELGNPNAYLGYWFIATKYSEKTEENKAKAEEMIQKMIETKNAHALYNVGMNLISKSLDFTDEERKKAVEYLSLSGDFGLTVSYENAADIYDYGLLGEVNGEKAYEFFLKGAESFEFTDWYDNVGYCYEEGVGVKQDYDKAFYYYELATHDGSEIAWFDLGRMYEEGKGVEKDLGKALQCYINSTKFKDPTAINIAGNADISIQSILADIH